MAKLSGLHGYRAAGAGVRLSLAIVLLSSTSAAALAATLPTGGQFVAGTGAIATGASSLSVNQSSVRGIINWQGFSIGHGNSVVIDNGAGATLNRVIGSNVSQIAGSLTATGSVYLVNQNGVAVLPGGTVVTGGSFVASTRDVANANFMAGGSQSFSGTSSGRVSNAGSITSTNGDVVLIGKSATNSGTISAPNGSAVIAAGDEVLLQPSGTAGQPVYVAAGSGDAANSGTIAAVQAQLDAAGGNVYALAGNNGGIIRATGVGTRGAHVWLTASGTTSVAGIISATNANGKGGTIETSGEQLNVGQANIHTGKGGSWLVDPTDLTINSNAATAISSALTGGTNVTEQTTATTASGGGAQTANGLGDIDVTAAINWTGNASLTLSAFHGIDIGADITTDTGALVLTTDNNLGGTSTGTGMLVTGRGDSVTFTGAGSLTINGNAYTLLRTASDVQNIGTSGYYALAGNIDLSSIANFTPIGLTSLDQNLNPNRFTGIFEGLGHTVANLTINDSTDFDLGLFSFVGSSALVENVTLTGTLTSGDNENYGLLAGDNLGTIANGFAQGTVNSNGGTGVGGLVGISGGTIMSSGSSGVVSGNGDVGGLVGENVGIGIVTTSTSSAQVSSPLKDGTVGGLVGFNYDGTITSSEATGAVSGYGYLGGLTGLNINGIVSTSDATGAITGGANSATVGGLVGDNQSGTIDASYATGAVTVASNGVFIGGLVGQSYDSVISNSYATGAVCGGSRDRDVGGLVGDNVSSSIATSYATGAVSGGSNGLDIGGLVGLNDGGTITAAYAAGAVSGLQYVGGLTGGNGGTITTSYATGVVRGTHNVGGLVGTNAPVEATLVTGTTTSSYWDVTTTGQSKSAGGTGLTTVQWLTEGPTATNAWDFMNTWVPGYPYPVLKALPYVVVNATGSQTYGSTGTISVNSVTNGAGQDVSGLVSTSSIGSILSDSANAGSYGFGGTGVAAPAGSQLTYEGSFTINPAELTYTATAATQTYGKSNTKLKGTVTGLVLGQTRSKEASGKAVFTTTATASSNVGSYAINGSGLTLNTGNYVLVQAASNATALTVDPAVLTYLATPVSLSKPGTAIPTLSGTVTGFVLGQTLASATTGTLDFTTLATSASPAGSYAIDGSGLAADFGDYVFVQSTKNATALKIR